MAPTIFCHQEKLLHNAKAVLSLCHIHHIVHPMLVVKVLAGNRRIVDTLATLDYPYIADSRIQNLKKFQHLTQKKVLLRLPMPSEANAVVCYADISLNSELHTINKLNEAARKSEKIHHIILMFDIGDLREGIYFADGYLSLVSEILKLKHIKLVGIGTNLTCYGGVIPTIENMKRFLDIKTAIEVEFKINLDIISGGNSSSFPLLIEGKLPHGINGLRFGEVVFCGRETAYGTILPDLYDDCFTLQAEVIEVKDKPSMPIGEIGMNSFGKIPKFIDKGHIRRAILALGKQDLIMDNIRPVSHDIDILGASSDHLIIDASRSTLQVGDVVTFALNYPGILHCMNSPYIKKVVQ